MKTAYSFIVLRYVHDVATGEFVNIGVALFAPEAKYIGGLCNTRYGRASKMFGDIDGEYYKGLMRYIEARFEELGNDFRSNKLPIFGAPPKDILQIAKSILPPDDSALQWSEPGGGLSENPTQTLEQLFERLVTRYETKQQQIRRDKGDIWKIFKKEFEKKHILNRLEPRRIAAKDYDYEFEHAWKNQQWRVYEPVSFDMVEAESILDKANRWLGRVTTLRDSPDKFKLHMLLGEPSDEKLRSAFIKAENILNKIPGEKEFIREHDAEAFSGVLAAEMLSHDKET